MSLFGCQWFCDPVSFFVFSVVFPFKQEQSVAVFHAFCFSGRGKQFLVNGKCIHKLPSYMSPAAASYSVLQLVVAIVSVADHVAIIVSEEL